MDVLTDVVIQNEKDYPPPGYQVLERTKDSYDKATNKKQISIKMLERHLASEAISDIIILSRNKRAPIGYTLAGEINGLVICYRLCSVPPLSQQQQQDSDVTVKATYHLSSSTHQAPGTGTHNGSGPELMDSQQRSSYFDNHIAASGYTRQDSSQLNNPMNGVPFQLSSRFLDANLQRTMAEVNSQCFVYKTQADLENEFDYSFSLEKTSLL